MIKLIILIVGVCFFYGVIKYNNGVILIDTNKGKELVSKVKEKVENIDIEKDSKTR